MSDPWEDLLQQNQPDPWESLLGGGDMPQVGTTLEGLDADAEAQELSQFRPITDPTIDFNGDPRRVSRTMGGPSTPQRDPSVDWFGNQSSLIHMPSQQPLTGTAGKAKWSGDALDTLGDFGINAAQGAYAGFGDDLAGLASPEMQTNIRDRQGLARERSPGWSLAGNVAGGAGPAMATAMASGPATAALPFAGRMAAGMGLGAEQSALAAAGDADDGSRWDAAEDAAPLGALAGLGGEAVASGIQGVANGVGNLASKGAPIAREAGLLDRAASTGKPMGELVDQMGGRQGVIEGGQWMEDQGINSWFPRELDQQIGNVKSQRLGDQRQFLDDYGQLPVDTEAVTQDLMSRGYKQAGLAPDSAQAQGSQYMSEAGNLADRAQGGSMPFQQAFDNRVAYDKAGKWSEGVGGDKGLAEVNRDAGNGLRGALGDALDATGEPLRGDWEGIQGDLSNAIPLSGGMESLARRSPGSIPNPTSVRSVANSLGDAMTKVGGRGALASGEIGLGKGLDAIGQGASGVGQSMGGGARAMSLDGAQQSQFAPNQPRPNASFAGMTLGGGGMQSEDASQPDNGGTRGYLLTQAAMAIMRQPGELGPYEKQFWDAANEEQSDAVSNLIRKLSHTDNTFRTQYLPKLQQLTSENF